jgi:hypothetical protein
MKSLGASAPAPDRSARKLLQIVPSRPHRNCFGKIESDLTPNRRHCIVKLSNNTAFGFLNKLNQLYNLFTRLDLAAHRFDGLTRV